jgi:poly(3-hydroxyoctanoate) depolymerase
VSVPSPEIQYVDLAGLRLRIAVAGKASADPPLLLINGIGAHLDLAAPFVRALNRRGVQTISYDAPGVGRSSPYVWPRRMSGVARTAERLLDALGQDTVDVFGVSLGGAVAQQLAHQAPQRVRRLVLAATGPGLGGVPGSPRVLWAMATPRRYYQPEYYRRVAPDIYGGAARRDPDALLNASLDRFKHRPTVRGYATQAYSIAGWTSVPWLRRLLQPTLVLAGDDDPIVPLVNGRILARLLPNARLDVISGGGHLFVLERPDSIADKVSEFLTAPIAPLGTSVSTLGPEVPNLHGAAITINRRGFGRRRLPGQ